MQKGFQKDNDTTIFDHIHRAYLLAVGNLDVRHERIVNEREHKERLTMSKVPGRHMAAAGGS